MKLRRDTVASFKQRTFLRKLGCPDAEIDACSSSMDLDDLFKAYKNIPSQNQVNYLRDKGVTDLPDTKNKASAIITRLRKECDANVYFIFLDLCTTSQPGFIDKTSWTRSTN